MSNQQTAHQIIEADADSILAVLTDPAACARWTPIEFDADLPPRSRLRSGERTVVEGRLAGQRAQFVVEFHRADTEQISLTATGPITIVARYMLTPAQSRTSVTARVGIIGGRGLTGKLLARAAEAFLAGGALSFALRRIAIEAETLARDATVSEAPQNAVAAAA